MGWMYLYLMEVESLPIVRRVEELEQRLRESRSAEGHASWGDQLLSCYLQTDPGKARLYLESKSSETGTAAEWKARGVLAMRRGEEETALRAFREGLLAAGMTGDEELQADILLDWAALEMNQSRWKDAGLQLEKAARLILRFPRPRGRFHLLIRQAFLAMWRHQSAAALTGFMQAEQLFPSIPLPLTWEDAEYLTLLHSGLGELYAGTGERDLARRHYFKAIEICRHYGLVYRLGWHYLNAGVASMALERWTEAAGAFREAIRREGEAPSAAPAWANLGHVCIRLGELDAAEDALRRAEGYYSQLPGDDRNRATVASWKARLANARGRREEVMQHYIHACELARAVQDNQLLATICKDISGFFATQGDFQNAWEYLSLHDQLGEKAREEAEQRKLMEIQVQYETKKVEQEAEQLRAQAMELRLQAMRAQMNPHFLFNALNGIQNLIHTDADSASRYLAKFAGLVRSALHLSTTELITLEEEVAFIRDYLLVNQMLRFQGRLAFSVSIEEDIDEDRVMVPPMMLQPFVENAIEHGFIRREKGQIAIEITESSPDSLCCSISDNGIGREAAMALRADDPHRENHQSMGMSITLERLELLNRSGFPGHHLDIQDLKNEDGQPAGTRVLLYFPIRRKGI